MQEGEQDVKDPYVLVSVCVWGTDNMVNGKKFPLWQKQCEIFVACWLLFVMIATR